MCIENTASFDLHRERIARLAVGGQIDEILCLNRHIGSEHVGHSIVSTAPGVVIVTVIGGAFQGEQWKAAMLEDLTVQFDKLPPADADYDGHVGNP